MKVWFTPHALRRAAQRGADVEHIRQRLENYQGTADRVPVGLWECVVKRAPGTGDLIVVTILYNSTLFAPCRRKPRKSRDLRVYARALRK